MAKKIDSVATLIRRVVFRCLTAVVMAWLFGIALSPLVRAEDLDQLEQLAFRAAVDRVAPSVVRIETVGGLDRVGEVMFGPGPTTGLIVSSDGYIVSSAFNFVNRPASILVQLPGGPRKPARLVATDHNRMVVLLKVDPDKPLSVPELAPQAEIRVGQWAIGVGRAFEEGSPNMSVGVVSATNRIWGKAIQTDAAISPNNYGGPLVDVQGRVLGVLVPLSPEETTELAGVEWYDSGIGFAVPSQAIQDILPRLKQGKDLRPGVIGIQLPMKTLHTADSVLTSVRPRSPAQKVGLKGGDRVIEIDGQKVDRAAQVKQELSRRYAGDKMRLAVLRDGKRIDSEVELAEKLEPYQQPFFGVLPLRSASAPEEKEKEKKANGIPVRYVFPDSPASKAGIQPGDVLIALGGEPIENPRKFRQRFAEKQPGDTVEFEVRHGKDSRKVQAQLAVAPETLPAGDLPPAHPLPKEQGKEKKPEVGTIQLKSPGVTTETWAYVPQGYQDDVPHGMIVWLQGAGNASEQETIAQWKALCDRYDLILILPKGASGGRWRASELRVLPRIIAPVFAAYNLDPTRVVIAGREAGGTAAYTAALGAGNLFHAAVVVDAPLMGRIADRETAAILSFYIAKAEQSRWTSAIRQTIAKLREMKFPVTVKELGPQPRDLTPAELGELARWIDTLDRI